MRRAGTLGPVVSKILYQPISIGLGIGAGLVARKTFDVLWDKIDGGSGDGPPKAGDQDSPLPRVVAAAAGLVGLEVVLPPHPEFAFRLICGAKA